MRVFDEQKDSIIATYTRFSRLQNFPLTVIALVRRTTEERKQRAEVDFIHMKQRKKKKTAPVPWASKK